jgi:hypothetical protein
MAKGLGLKVWESRSIFITNVLHMQSDFSQQNRVLMTPLLKGARGEFLKQSWRLRKFSRPQKNSCPRCSKLEPILLKIGALEKTWRLCMPVGANWSVGRRELAPTEVLKNCPKVPWPSLCCRFRYQRDFFPRGTFRRVLTTNEDYKTCLMLLFITNKRVSLFLKKLLLFNSN